MLVWHRVLSISVAVAFCVAGIVHGEGVFISLALGVSLGIVVAFSLDAVDDTIKNAEDVPRRLQLSLLGQIAIASHERPALISDPRPLQFKEAYRALGASLVPVDEGGPRFIIVTSAQPREGKTTTACNHGLTLAATGSRVLLIDANMDRPGLAKALGLNGVGLSQVLMGQARTRDAIQRTRDPGLCVMTAGPMPADSSELVSSDRMKQLVATLRQSPFDWVLIDTPALLTARDAAVLASLGDGVIFVVRAGTTRVRTVERALEIIGRSKIKGAVLNRVRR